MPLDQIEPPLRLAAVEDFFRSVFYQKFIDRTASQLETEGFENSDEFRQYRMKVRDVVNGQGERRS